MRRSTTRLSTLYGCLRPLPRGASAFVESEDGETQSWLVCYNLEDEEFVIADTASIRDSWLPLTSVLDSVRLLAAQRKFAARPDADALVARADALAETFRNYKLPVIPIVTDNLADATRTFQRVNRK
jgi:hypothetical protein